jgi:general secretion pathway protein D
MIRAWTLAALCSLLVACASGSIPFYDGRELLLKGETEAGLAKLEEAVRASPNNAKYRETYEKEKAIVVRRYLSEGDLLRSSGELAAAQAAYQRALKLAPNDARGLGGMVAIDVSNNRKAIVERAKADFEADKLDQAEATLRLLLKQDPGQREARSLLNQIDEKRADTLAQLPPPALKGPFKQPITLEFRDASIKSVFEVISRASGINFVFDRDVRADTKINIFVRNTSLDDVVRLILVTNQLERKLLNDNTLLIYPNTPAKQKEYKELVVRSFYLANTDAKQALNLVKGMVKTPDVFIDEKLNLIMVKDTPDAMRVIANLVRALDLAEPEVVLEVEVLEIASTKLQQLGVKYPESIRIGTPPTSIGAAIADTFIIGQNPVKVFVANPPIVLDLKARDGDVKVLANPRTRVKNREKAKVHIGEKVPVITTTSTANVGVSSSVSYLDVGLKLDVEANVYLHDEVSMKVNLEVSNIRDKVNVNGTLAYEIGTRTTATVLQLANGETGILAGLISDEERRTADKVPGLGDFPILGRLFRTQGDDVRKTEIVLMITPRIVRSITYPQSAVVDMPVGTDAAIGAPSMRIAPTQAGAVALAPSGGTQGVVTPRPLPAPIAGAPGGAPVESNAAQMPGTPSAPPGGVPGTIPGAPQEPGAAGPPSSLLVAAPLAARSGSDIAVSLSLTPGAVAIRATAELAYDPMQLEPVGATAPTPGRLPVRIEGSAAVRFRVLLAGGRAQVRVENVVGLDAGGNSVPVVAPGAVEVAVNQ